MSLQTKKFCRKQGLQREVSPVMTSIKYTNGTFSTILQIASISVLYTQSKWFDLEHVSIGFIEQSMFHKMMYLSNSRLSSYWRMTSQDRAGLLTAHAGCKTVSPTPTTSSHLRQVICWRLSLAKKLVIRNSWNFQENESDDNRKVTLCLQWGSAVTSSSKTESRFHASCSR